MFPDFPILSLGDDRNGSHHFVNAKHWYWTDHLYASPPPTGKLQEWHLPESTAVKSFGLFISVFLVFIAWLHLRRCHKKSLCNSAGMGSEIPLVRTGWLAVGPAWQRLPMKTSSVDSSPARLQFRFKADWQRIRVLSVTAAPTDTALNSSPARRPYPERTAIAVAVANRTTSRGRARLP